MTKETKPTSKIKEMLSTASHVLFLCEDGSSWSYWVEREEWICILEPHKEPVEEERELKKGNKVIYTDEITKEEIKGTISSISVFCGDTVYFIDSLPDTYINEESLRLQETVDEEPTKEKLNPFTSEGRRAFENLKKWLSETDDGEDYKSLFYQIVDKAHDLVDAMEAKQEKPEEPKGWQPIETAPKDNKVDLWNDDGRFTDCYYDDICNEWRRTGRSCILTRINKPTHWMPLPEEPSE